MNPKTDETVQVPISTCPVCGYEVDCATPVTNDPEKHIKPVPGDVTLCIKCGEVMAFDKNMKLRSARIDDIISLSSAEFHALDVAQKMIRERRPRG